jgi:GNAT superfamily N-acetyltransferase
MGVVVREISSRNKREFREFLKVPFRIYDRESPWVAPLHSEVRSKLNPTENSFFEFGRVHLFMAYDDNDRACGRIAAIVNPEHEKIHGEKRGFFGLFECVNDGVVAQELFNAVFQTLRATGCDSILGPVNLSTNDESGFLLEGYDQRPTFMCNYCPSYYHDLMIGCGLDKAMDTLSYEAWHGHSFPDKYYRIVKRVEANPRVSVRRFSKAAAHEDALIIAKVYNAAFCDTWGFVPLSDGEAVELTERLLPIADLDLIWIAMVDDKPVGAILAFPDINEILAKLNGRLFPFGFLHFLFGLRKISGMRVAALGVIPAYRSRGIESVLAHRVHQRIHNRPYLRSEFSVVMENNQPMRNLVVAYGFTPCRRFRLYQRDIPEVL